MVSASDTPFYERPVELRHAFEDELAHLTVCRCFGRLCSGQVASLHRGTQSPRCKDARATTNRIVTLMKTPKDGEGQAFVGLFSDQLKTLSWKNDRVVLCGRLKVKQALCGLCLYSHGSRVVRLG